MAVSPPDPCCIVKQSDFLDPTSRADLDRNSVGRRAIDTYIYIFNLVYCNSFPFSSYTFATMRSIILANRYKLYDNTADNTAGNIEFISIV